MPARTYEEQAITTSVTVTGETAALLRELAAVEGRTPEALAVEWAAGKLSIPPKPVTAEDLEIFDGPPDLGSAADEYLRQGFGQ